MPRPTNGNDEDGAEDNGVVMILLGMELFLVDDEKERLREPSSSKPIK